MSEEFRGGWWMRSVDNLGGKRRLMSFSGRCVLMG
jgi:hypothetical protein